MTSDGFCTNFEDICFVIDQKIFIPSQKKKRKKKLTFCFTAYAAVLICACESQAASVLNPSQTNNMSYIAAIVDFHNCCPFFYKLV